MDAVPYDISAAVRALVGSGSVLVYGAHPDGSVASWDARTAPHLVAVGPARCGRSVLCRGLAVTAIASGADVLVLNPTHGDADFDLLDGAPGFQMVTGLRDSARRAEELLDDVRRRNTLLDDRGVRDVYGLDASERWPRTLVIIDSDAGLVDRGNDEDFDRHRLRTCLEAMGRAGRPSGASLVVSTQQGGKGSMFGRDRLPLAAHLLLGRAAGAGVPAGDGVWEQPSATEHDHVRVWDSPTAEDVALAVQVRAWPNHKEKKK